MYELVAAEISSVSRYADEISQIDKMDHDDGLLFELCEAPTKHTLDVGSIEPKVDARRVFLLNGNLNYSEDICKLLERLHNVGSRHDRVAAVVYNSYLRWLYALFNYFGWRQGPLPRLFITARELETVAKLTRMEIVRSRSVGFLPTPARGIGGFVNRFLAVVPIVRNLSLMSVVWFRPIKASESKPSLSIVVPAGGTSGGISHNPT